MQPHKPDPNTPVGGTFDALAPSGEIVTLKVSRALEKHPQFPYVPSDCKTCVYDVARGLCRLLGDSLPRCRRKGEDFIFRRVLLDAEEQTP